MPAKKVYAIKMNEWVQIRVATEEPKVYITEVKKPVSVHERRIVYTREGRAAFKMVKSEKTLNIKVAYHEGGTVVCCMKYVNFCYMTATRLNDGQMIELKPPLDKIRLKHWRRSHGF